MAQGHKINMATRWLRKTYIHSPSKAKQLSLQRLRKVACKGFAQSETTRLSESLRTDDAMKIYWMRTWHEGKSHG